jgi:hypothetical protein
MGGQTPLCGFLSKIFGLKNSLHPTQPLIYPCCNPLFTVFYPQYLFFPIKTPFLGVKGWVAKNFGKKFYPKVWDIYGKALAYGKV